MSALSGPQMLGRLLDVSGRPAELAGVNPMQAARAAMNWRLAARLHAEMRRRGLEGIFAPEDLAALRGAHMLVVMRNRVLRRRAVETLRALIAAGLRPLVLKGGIELLSTPEGSDCTRFMEDLDLLLAPSEYEAAYAVLASLGFEATCPPEEDHHHGPPMRDPRCGLVVELHWRPFLFEHPHFAAEMFARAEPLPVEPGLRVLIPCPAHQLLHNMVHAQDNHMGFLLGTAELRRSFEFAERCVHFGDAIDWPALLAQSAELGFLPHMASWLWIAHRLFGLPLPQGLRVGLVERHQARHIINEEMRPHWQNSAERIALYHLFVPRGIFRLRDLGFYYRYWLGRGLQQAFRLPEPALRPAEGWQWPRGRQRTATGHG